MRHDLPATAPASGKAKKVPVAILARVSTARQDTDRQRTELEAHAAQKGYDVVKVFEENRSGRAHEDERAELHELLEMVRTGVIKKVLVHEVSRLSRRSSIVHRFVETLEAFGASLYWHAQGLETLLPSGKRNPATAMMLAILSEMARAEVETMRERIMSGLAEARRKGRTLGRPKGSTAPPKALLAKHRDIVKCLRANQSVRHTAKITGKGISTVQRIKALAGRAATSKSS